MIKEISDYEVEQGGEILDNHIVHPLNKESALESLLFCIASQALPWEKTTRFIYNLRKVSYPRDGEAIKKISTLEVLSDNNLVNRVAYTSKLRFANQFRFDDALDYFLNLDNEWWLEVANADVTTREKYLNEDIKWCGRKTFSFWHLCLGGKNLIALDVHVMKNLSKLGININPTYFTPIRIGSQKVRDVPGKKEYLRIEEEAYALFSSDERFLLGSKRVDMALVDAVLWWKGANRGTLYPPDLFNMGSAFTLLYPKK